MSTTQMSGHHNGHQALDKNWTMISVRDFFERIPWTGFPVSVSDNTSDNALVNRTEADSLNLKLKVSEYFNLFPWDGQPSVAVPVVPIELQPDLPAEDDITLEGFADLF